MRGEKAFAVTKTGDLKMSGKFLSRASALSLAVFLAACGGDESSTPIVNVNTGQGDETSTPIVNEDGVTDGTTSDPTASLTLGVYDSTQDFFAPYSIKRNDGNDTPIAASGSANFKVNVYNTDTQDLASSTPIEIVFSSGCVTEKKARLSRETVVTSNGSAETTYTPTGCSGQDVLTAALVNSATDDVAQIEFEVAEPSIVDISASAPSQTSLAPTGPSGSPDDRPSQSEIAFTVIGESGPTGSGTTVEFELIPQNSSAYLLNENERGTTDSSGVVIAKIQAGDDNEIIRVAATVLDVAGSPITTTTSAPVAINSNLAIASRFSLSLDSFSINARNIDGVKVNATIRAADQYGNDIRGNTIVNFSASEGSITGDCTLSNEGSCSVIWKSLNAIEPRPTIYAYTQGERRVSGDNCFEPDNDCVFERARITDFETFVQSSARDVKAEIIQIDGNYCASVYAQIMVDGQSVNIIPPGGTAIEFTATNATLTGVTSDTVPNDDPNIVDDEKFEKVCVTTTKDNPLESAELVLTVTTESGTPITKTQQL